jgi:hypothetical protein
MRSQLALYVVSFFTCLLLFLTPSAATSRRGALERTLQSGALFASGSLVSISETARRVSRAADAQDAGAAVQGPLNAPDGAQEQQPRRSSRARVTAAVVRENQEQREDADRARQQQQQQRQQLQQQREDAQRALQQQQQQRQQQHLQRDQEAGQRETVLNKLGLHLEYDSLASLRARKKLVGR